MSWFMLKPFFLQVFPSDIDFAEPNTEEAAADISPQVYLDFPFFFKNSLVLSEYCVCKNLKCVFSRLWMTCTTRCEALWRTETKYFARSWELTPSLTFWQSAVMKQSLIIGQKPMWWVFSNWNTFCLSCPVKSHLLVQWGWGVGGGGYFKLTKALLHVISKWWPVIFYNTIVAKCTNLCEGKVAI